MTILALRARDPPGVNDKDMTPDFKPSEYGVTEPYIEIEVRQA